MFNVKIPEWTSKRGTVMWIMDLSKMELDGDGLSDRILMRWIVPHVLEVFAFFFASSFPAL